MVVVPTKVLVSIGGAHGLRSAAKQGKVLCQGRDVSVLNVVDGLAGGAFEFVGRVLGAGVVSGGGPLSAGIADV